MHLNRAVLALSALLASTSALPHLGKRDIEKGIVVISIPTKTETPCVQPIQPLPSGITAPTGMPCPSGTVCLPPLGPWPFIGPYDNNNNKPPSKYANGFKPVGVADGPFPAVGGHAWNVPYQPVKICGTGSLPAATGTGGIPSPVRTGVGVVPMPTGTATVNTPTSYCANGAACPSGRTGATIPAPVGAAAPSYV